MNLLNDVPKCITRIAKKFRKWKIILLFWKILHSSKCQTKTKNMPRRGKPIIAADSFKSKKNQNIKSIIKRKHEKKQTILKNCYSGLHDRYTNTSSEANEHHWQYKDTNGKKPPKKRGSYTYNYPGLAINWKVWFRLDGWCLKGTCRSFLL